MISWFDTFAVIYTATAKPLRSPIHPKKGKIYILIGAETEGCQLKIYVQFYQHPSYPLKSKGLRKSAVMK